MTQEYKPRYSGANRAGICKCGHSWEEHHLSAVVNLEYLKATNERYFPEECEFYGSNEQGGLGPNGEDHCHWYIDKLERAKPKRLTAKKRKKNRR